MRWTKRHPTLYQALQLVATFWMIGLGIRLIADADGWVEFPLGTALVGVNILILIAWHEP